MNTFLFINSVCNIFFPLSVCNIFFALNDGIIDLDTGEEYLQLSRDKVNMVHEYPDLITCKKAQINL